ncbi:T9SS type B sorting domain-containing protein [Flavobacterium supellecticarium]|uniref:T9SS type B sorting domain-containing protein n=1 Tax=Flavobacterium supellecticarium TaxID=2565924 RepID=A0A4S3ZQA2_9FLAO|nr:fibronectin type III domain-containing protein [Flavobacterium supellecticarium]THF47718.1 T9SS type B sorting domain-containing protein [Flavobacterium supellecticarium]
MKKITLLILMSLLSFVSYSQVFPEGFEGAFPPSGPGGAWAVSHNGIGMGPGNANLWVRTPLNSTTSPPHTGNYAAMVERVNIGDGNTEQDWLISPLVTVPANGQLRFYGLHGRAGDQGSKLKIKISTTSGAQTTLANFTIEVANLTETQVSPVAGEYREVVVNLTPAVAANQQVYIAFVREHTQVGTAADGDRFVIDDINMVQRCLDPTNGVANNVTTNSAILSWTNPSGSTQWEVELIPSTDAFTGTGQIVNSNPYTATTTATGAPIAPGTVYQYKVRSICTGGVPSDWAGPFYFTTVTLGQTCAAPITINQLPYSTTDNTSNYGNNITGSQGTTGCGTTTNYLTGNDVVYAYTATFTGNIDISMTPTATYSGIFVYNNCANIGTSCLAGIGNSNSNIRNIPNFPVTAGTTYYFVISTNAAPQTTGYTLVIQRVTCTPPGALAVAGITMNSANLSWSNPSSGTEWEVVVQALGAGIPQGAGTAVTTGPAYAATTTVTGTPLASGTDYEYYVRVKCPDGSFSQWSGPKPFKTLPNYCAGDHFFDPGGPNGQYANSANVTTTICPTNPGDIVTVTFNSFDTESGYDFVRVYNGPNATSPLLGTYSGNLTGANLPGPFESSGPGACLTFVFTSDGSGIRDGWDATVTCAPPPTCPKPKNLAVSNITAHSAQLNWLESGTATSWVVIAVPAGTPNPNSNPIPGTAITATVTTPPPYVLNGLSSNTDYDYYVRAVCSPTDSSTWAGPRNFKTQPDFCAGDHFFDPGGPNAQYGNNANVTTTICAPTPADIVTVTFLNFNTESGYDFVRVYNGPNATSPLLGTYSGALTGANLPGPFESNVGGCLTFVFTSDGSGTRDGWEATVTCGPPPTCPKPKNFVASNPTMNSVQLNWLEAGTATSWIVMAVPTGTPDPNTNPIPGTAITATVTTPPPYVLGGLTSNTEYDFYVRAVCSPTDSSTWTGPRTLRTLPNYCAGDHFYDPGGPNGQYGNSANVTTTICPANPTDMVTVTFNSFNTEAGYDFVRVYEGTGTTGTLLGTYAGDLTNNLPGPFESTVGGCLTFVFTSDGSGVRDGWDATVTCAPPPTCPKPKNLSAANMTQTSADLNWQEMGTATQWEVIVLPAGSAPPAPGDTGVIVNTPPPFTYSGPPALLPGRPYDFYVRAICSPTDSSAWSIKGTFRTLISNDECTAPIHVPVNEDSLCGQTTPGTLAGATASALPNTCGGNPNDDVWFEFTATHTQHYIALLNTTSTGLNTDNMYHSVYSACGGTPIVCSDPNNSLVNGLVPGQNYLIRVYSNAATAQSFTFNLCVGTVITCADAQAFCANNTSPSITFPGSIGVPNLGTVACLTTTPNPTWYFLQVQQSGNLQFQISQTSTTGQGIDVDFIAYGPFTSPTAGCGNLGPNVGCSYSSASVENFNIPNAISGQYYLIEITNYNGSAGNITLAQTNQGQSGAGSTNCDIVCTVDLGPDKILCGQTSYTLDAGIVNATTYTWYNGTNVIPGATGQTLTVTQSGTYSVVVTKPSCSNNPTDSVNITFGPTINQVTMPDYKVCDDISNDGLADFDLSTLTPQVVAGQNPAFTYNVTYHASSADATAGVNPIDATVPYNSNTKTIYIRVEGANSATCFGVIPVNLVVKLMPIVTMPATYSVCTGSVTIIGTPQNYTAANNPTYTWYFGTTVIAGETTDQITVSQPGTYTLEVTVDGCTNSVSTVVTNDGVTVTAPDDVTVCGSYTLPTLTAGTYYTGSGATGTVLNAGDVITSTQTIYVYLQSTVNPSCYAEDSFNVNITTNIVAPVIPSATVCDSYTLQPLPSFANYYTGTGGTGTLLTAGSTITTSQTIYVYAKSGVAPNFCTDESSFVVTIQTATADAPENVASCGAYTLPALSANNNYYTGPGGTGTMLNAGDPVNGTTVLYVYTSTSAGCNDENSFTVTIYNTPTVATLPDVTVECEGYTLPALPAGNAYYTGTGGTGAQLQAGQVVSTTQTVYIFAQTGTGSAICTNESSFEISASCVIPRGISPNNDGLNDTFDLSNFEVEKLSIFNRYGTEVYSHGTGYTKQWFGQSKGGSELPDGTYFYVIELKGGDTKTGWVYISREK